MTATGQSSELLITVRFHQLQQLRVFTEKMFAHVVAFFQRKVLHFSIKNFIHAFDEQTCIILLKQMVPVIAPDHLNNVPACALESGFQFLDDFTISTDAPSKPSGANPCMRFASPAPSRCF